MGEFEFKFKHLGDGNYSVWAVKMKAVLVHRGLWKVVEQGVDTGGSDAACSSEKDEKALSAIHLFVEDHVLHEIVACESARDAWQKLLRLYKARAGARLVSLRQALSSLRMGNETCSQFLSRVTELRNDLSAAGEVVSDVELVVGVLKALPQSYAYFVGGIEARDELPEFSVLCTKLRAYAEKLKDGKSSVGDVLYGRGDRTGERRSVSKLKCYYCGKLGHKEAQCFKKKNKEQGEKKKTPDDGVILVSIDDAVQTLANEWVLDSGSTHHVTNQKAFLHDFCDSRTVPIRYGSGEVLDSCGMGTVRLLVDGSQRITLQEVLYVPQAPANLISIRRVTQKGVKTLFEDDVCQLVHGKVTIATARSSGGLYKLQSSVECAEGAEVLLSVNESAELWHRRLGHAGMSCVGQCVRAGAVKGVGVNLPATNLRSARVCPSCTVGKMTRVSFGESQSRSTEQLELVHSDVCGPLQEESV